MFTKKIVGYSFDSVDTLISAFFLTGKLWLNIWSFATDFLYEGYILRQFSIIGRRKIKVDKRDMVADVNYCSPFYTSLVVLHESRF